jgi:RNA polymerase sigma-70 factor (ECF subfamily)
MSVSLAEPDAVLVRAAQAGDRAAFDELYARYVRVVHGMLLARLPAADADDGVQDVFITALTKLNALRDPAAFAGWITTIARNRAAEFHRRAIDNVQLDVDYGARATQGGAAEAARALDEIRRLPDAYRETLMLRLVEGMTGPEIAERTGLTPGSVRVNLHRGMQLLREAMGAT